MTLDTTAFLASFDITDKTQDLDISAVLLSALMVDTGILGQIPMGDPVYDTVFYANEIALNTDTVTVDGTGYSSTFTSVSFVSTAGLRIGALLKNVVAGDSEVAQVTAITDATTAVVTRGYGSTSAGAGLFAADAVVNIISQPLQEGSDIQVDHTKVPSVLTFNTQIFERSIKITRNQLKRRMVAIADFLAQSIHDRTMELKRELELAVIHSVTSGTPAGSDSVYRTMSGLLELISNSYSTGEAMSLTVFNDMVQNLVDSGAADAQSHLVSVNPTKIRRTISSFDSSNRRLMESDVRAGYYIEQVRTDLGIVVDVVTSNYLGAGSASPWTSMLLDTSRIKLRPFADDTFKLMAATDFKDGVQRRILGEFGLEVRNQATAHRVHTGLTG